MRRIRSTLRHCLVASSCVLAGLTGLSTFAQAADLTPFGAIQGPSADGAIPAYAGGITAMSGLPTGRAAKSVADPFAGERPLFSITAANMSQYADQLTPGTQALLRRYPEFRVDVYPTHRTASYPDWVLQNDVKNASSARIVGDNAGVSGAYGGVPFPKPANGNEAMWNSILNYQPASCHEYHQGYLVDSSGSVTFLGDLTGDWAEPYYDPSTSSMGGKWWRIYADTFVTPAAVAGTTDLFYYPIDFSQNDDTTYDYTPGTRRVRLAPQFKYDTPIASYGGSIDFDEIDLFYGSLDKFNFSLVGRKEMIVPYNVYKVANTTEAALLGSHTLKPDGMRWERHRVWVVDAVLKPGERHSYAKWNFYIDEDSYKILATESYDHSGAVYRVGYAYPYQNYADGPGNISFSHTFGVYDLSKSTYMIAYSHTHDAGHLSCKAAMPNLAEFSPQSMLRQVH